MLIELQDLVPAEVVYGVNLQWSPRWSLRSNSLLVAPYHSGDAHEKHFLQTNGSGNWYRSEFEEFRFGKEDGILQSLWFHVPEVNLASESLIGAWQAQQPVEGLLHLSSSQGFAPEVTDFRWMNPNGEFFACVTEVALIDVKERLRLRITHDFELLFADRKLCGWLLSHPTHYLVGLWEDPYSAEPDSEIAALVHEYLTLVAEPYIEQMEDENPEILQALINLYTRIDCKHRVVNQRRVLCDCIEYLVEKFYNQKSF